MIQTESADNRSSEKSGWRWPDGTTRRLYVEETLTLPAGTIVVIPSPEEQQGWIKLHQTTVDRSNEPKSEDSA